MLLSQVAQVKWNNKNRKYYENKCYTFTNNGDIFLVNIEDLSPSSKGTVEVSCDFCGEIIEKAYQTYKTQHHPLYGDCCAECQPIKNKKICLDKYGVDNGSKTQEAINKIKQTSMERYGVDNPSKTEQAREKISVKSKQNNPIVMKKVKATMKELYGVENAFQSEEIKAKIKDTMLSKYGVDHPKKSSKIKEKERLNNLKKYGVESYTQTEECKNKMKQTCLERYGVEYTLQAKEVREKISASLLKNGNVPTSKPQIELFNLLKEEYGECYLNKPCGSCFLDCALTVNGIYIDVEFDGAYWHQDEQRDRKRDEFVKTQGYKIFRIIGTHEIPTIEEIRSRVDFLLSTAHTFTCLNLT